MSQKSESEAVMDDQIALGFLDTNCSVLTVATGNATEMAELAWMGGLYVQRRSLITNRTRLTEQLR